MARAQGSLEYLIIIAIVLAVSGIVISYMTGIVGGQRSTITLTGCKQAAVDCKATKLLSSTDPCLSCDTACKDSSGVELFDGATYCCNHGQPEMIFADSPGCYACGDTNLCPNGLNCINHECLTCTPATESLYCLAPTPVCLNNICVECEYSSDCTSPTTPYCVNNRCVACEEDTNCALGYICSNGACVAGCRDSSKCLTGQLCCAGACQAPCDPNINCVVTGDATCFVSKACRNPNSCDLTCDVTYRSVGYTCAPTTNVWSCRAEKGGQWWTVETKNEYTCDANHACARKETVTENPCDCSTCYLSGGMAYCESRTVMCVGSTSGYWCGYSITAAQACYCYPGGGGILYCKIPTT